MIYRERVLPSAANLILPILLFFSIYGIMLPIDLGLALPSAFAVTALFASLMFFSSPTIEVTDSILKCKGASIERRYVGDVLVIQKSEIFDELGRKLDARAWLSVQASIKCLVKIEISDKNDPTPYWLVSTRKPELLVAALKKG